MADKEKQEKSMDTASQGEANNTGNTENENSEATAGNNQLGATETADSCTKSDAEKSSTSENEQISHESDKPELDTAKTHDNKQDAGSKSTDDAQVVNNESSENKSDEKESGDKVGEDKEDEHKGNEDKGESQSESESEQGNMEYTMDDILDMMSDDDEGVNASEEGDNKGEVLETSPEKGEEKGSEFEGVSQKGEEPGTGSKEDLTKGEEPEADTTVAMATDTTLTDDVTAVNNDDVIAVDNDDVKAVDNGDVNEDALKNVAKIENLSDDVKAVNKVDVSDDANKNVTETEKEDINEAIAQSDSDSPLVDNKIIADTDLEKTDTNSEKNNVCDDLENKTDIDTEKNESNDTKDVQSKTVENENTKCVQTTSLSSGNNENIEIKQEPDDTSKTTITETDTKTDSQTGDVTNLTPDPSAVPSDTQGVCETPGTSETQDPPAPAPCEDQAQNMEAAHVPETCYVGLNNLRDNNAGGIDTQAGAHADEKLDNSEKDSVASSEEINTDLKNTERTNDDSTENLKNSNQEVKDKQSNMTQSDIMVSNDNENIVSHQTCSEKQLTESEENKPEDLSPVNSGESSLANNDTNTKKEADNDSKTEIRSKTEPVSVLNTGDKNQEEVSEKRVDSRPLVVRQNSAINRLDTVLATVDLDFDLEEDPPLDGEETIASNVDEPVIFSNPPEYVGDDPKEASSSPEKVISEPDSLKEEASTKDLEPIESKHKDTDAEIKTDNSDAQLESNKDQEESFSVDEQSLSNDNIMTSTPKKDDKSDVDKEETKQVVDTHDVYAMDVDTMLEIPSLNGNATFTRPKKKSMKAENDTSVDEASETTQEESGRARENSFSGILDEQDPGETVLSVSKESASKSSGTDSFPSEDTAKESDKNVNLNSESETKNAEINSSRTDTDQTSDKEISGAVVDNKAAQPEESDKVNNNSENSDATLASSNANKLDNSDINKTPSSCVQPDKDNNAQVQTSTKDNNTHTVLVQDHNLSTICEDVTGDNSSNPPKSKSPASSGVVMRKKHSRPGTDVPDAAVAKQAGLSQEEILQQKIDFEIKMRDGTAKLMNASKNPRQLLEAAKSLLTSNSRMMSYMSELQRSKANGATQSMENEKSEVCKGKVCVSELRIPLMWRDTDYFKNKGDHRRFAVFCMVRLGTEIHDTSLVNEVDSSMTDIQFDDVITFADVEPGFEVALDVYSHKMTADDEIVASTPRKIKKHINKISTSVGRRLSGLKQDHDHMGHMIVGPKFEKIAEATLTLSDVSNSICTYNFTPQEHVSDSHHSELPLFGNICCKLAAQPRCMNTEVFSSQLSVRKPKDPSSPEYWVTLKDQMLSMYGSPAQCHAHKPPILTIPINKTTEVREISKDADVSVEISNKTARVRTKYLLQAADDVTTRKWGQVLQQHVANQVSWQHACEVAVDLSDSPPQRASSFMHTPAASSRKTAQTLYDNLEVDSPMTRILNRLNIDMEEEVT